MKKLMVLSMLGATLFLGTVVGLLAAQGRLNHAGTRGIPVLASFFPPPPELPQTPSGDANSPDAGGYPAPNAEPSLSAGPNQDPRAERSSGLGKEENLPYRVGPSVLTPQPAAGGGGQGAPAGGSGADASLAGGPGTPAAGATGMAQGEPHGGLGDAAKPDVNPDWAAKIDSVFAQGQYRPGRLWRFPQIETGVGVEELNQILLRARQQQLDLDRDRSAVQKQQAELEARERDVADRQDAVLEKLRDIEQLRAKLQAEIDEFHNTVLLIRQDEVAGLQSVAKTLAAVEAKSAASVIKKWWETDDGQTKALKIWTVMEPDAANAILAELDIEMIRQVLEQRLKVAREQAKAKK